MAEVTACDDLPSKPTTCGGAGVGAEVCRAGVSGPAELGESVHGSEHVFRRSRAPQQRFLGGKPVSEVLFQAIIINTPT